MIEQIDQLEEGVVALMNMLDEMGRRNEQLQRENEELRRGNQSANDAAAQSEHLQTRVNQLEGEVESMADKMTQMRQHLPGIQATIDSIENELSPGAGADQDHPEGETPGNAD